MITATKLPDTLALAENPIWVGLQTDNLITTSGSKAAAEISFTQNATVGQHFTFNFGETSIVFTCAATPDDSGLQFATSNLILAAWVGTLINVLKKNYTLSKYFTIATGSSNTKILVTAIENGTGFDCSFSDITVTGATATATAGVDEAVRSDFKIVLQILQNNALLHEELLDVDADGKAQADISEILLPVLENKFTYPATTALIVKQTGMCEQFDLRFAEKYDDTVHVFSTITSFRAIKGGISKLDQAIFNQNSSSFYDTVLANKQFLTNAPKEMKVCCNSEIRLNFCLLEGITTVNLLIEKYFDDLLDETETFYQLTGLSIYDFLEFIVKIDNNLQQNYTKIIVYLTDENNTEISERRTYYIDTATYYNKRSLLFRNSLGGYEIFTLKGVGEINNDFERIPYKNALDLGFTTEDFETTQGNILQTKTLTVNTGWLNMAELNWLGDIMLRKEVYLISGDTIIPYTVVSKKQKQKQDDKFLYSIDIELQESYLNAHLSDFNGVNL